MTILSLIEWDVEIAHTRNSFQPELGYSTENKPSPRYFLAMNILEKYDKY